MDWATARGLRKGDNPARWKGHLDQLLPARAQVQQVKHHAALPYAKVGKFMAGLRAEEGATARALEFLILTAARTDEVVSARWAEFDLVSAVWTVPPERMKGKKEHRVPLSAGALAIVRKLHKTRTDEGEFVFSGRKEGRHLSNMAMLMLLKRLGHGDITVHGFRSTFRDWAAEQTNFPHEVAEEALAHATSNKVVAAYRRGDFFDKRRKLMDAWARFCSTPSAARAGSNVVNMAGGRR